MFEHFQIKKKILSYNKVIHSNLEQIEKLGGGSARCMIAENFLQKNKIVNCIKEEKK